MKGCAIRGLWGAASLVVLGLVLYLVGLRVELAGSGMPRLRFGGEAALYDRLEADRAEQESADTSAASQRLEAGWSLYRGDDGSGVYRGPIRLDWQVNPPQVLYEQPIGGGYASFVAGESLVFTIEQRRDEEAVVAYEPRTGREVWVLSWPARFSEAMGGDGPRATPAYSEGRVYALGGQGELAAIEAKSGQLIWRTNILEDAQATNIQWGMSGSPLIVDGRLIVQPGGSDGSIVAYEAANGEIAWRALSDQTSYASPRVVELAGQRQLLALTAIRLVGLTVDGEGPLWEYPWQTFNFVNAAQPILIGGNRVFVSSGYGLGAAVIEVTASGDSFEVREVWRNEAMKNRFATSVFYDGYIYGLDEGILACVDAATGERRWKGGRYGHGQLLLTGDHLLILSERGDLVLVKATPESHQEVSQLSVLKGKTWNNPAIVGGLLLVRNAQQMAAIDLTPES